MARRSTNTKRVTKSETYLINRKYLGDEPELMHDYSETEFGNALTWYNYMATTDEAREYLDTFLKNQGRFEEAKKLKQVSDTAFPLTAAWVARMINRGVKVSDYSRKFIEDNLNRVFSKITTVKEEKPQNVIPVSVQQRMKDKASEILGQIENIVDDRVNQKDFSLYEWLKKNEVPAVYSSMIVATYAPWLQELLEAVCKEDEQLVEAYAKVPSKKMDYDIKFLNMLIEDAERYGTNTKKIRAPRKPRPVSVEKQLKNLKYQKDFPEMKIVSVKPEKIIGCQELWTYNTRYKTLTVIRAIDRGGLAIKGTSIINYDEKTSVTKRTGRKAEEYVNRVLNGGKILLRKIMEELKLDAPLSYRINENTILLKVV